MIDAHCHVHWNAELPRVMAEARTAGIQHVICNATEEADWTQVLHLREEYGDFVIPSIGVHPWFCGNLAPGWEDRLRLQLLESPFSLIGEIGIDHYHSKCSTYRLPPKALQAEVFTAQLHLADSLHRQFSVHCVRAHGKALKLLQECVKSGTKFLMHSWSGAVEMSRALLLAFPQSVYFSVSQASVTDEKVIPSLREIPGDRILIETDSPCLCMPNLLEQYNLHPILDSNGSPVNEPKYLFSSLQKLSELRSDSPSTTQVFENTQRFLSEIG